MITWDHLVECIEKLQTLPNGSGAEIEFTYNGVNYGIVSYSDSADIEILPEQYLDHINKTIGFRYEGKRYEFKTLRELGKSNIYGFVIADIWGDLTVFDYSIRPDFDSDDFESIFDAYERACKKRK